MLDQDDDALAWDDYCRLFGPYFPAGHYDEVAYFLPAAFAYLRANDSSALDLVTAVFGFCSTNSDRLASGGVLEDVKAEIQACFKHWTQDFVIHHYDQSACQKKGWSLPYFDYVQHSEVIAEGLTDLVRFESLADLATDFITSLSAHQDNAIKAAWFIECSRSRFDVYSPPDHGTIIALLSDKEQLRQAYSVVLNSAIGSSQSPTYWEDAIHQLGL